MFFKKKHDAATDPDRPVGSSQQITKLLVAVYTVCCGVSLSFSLPRGRGCGKEKKGKGTELTSAYQTRAI